MSNPSRKPPTLLEQLTEVNNKLNAMRGGLSRCGQLLERHVVVIQAIVEILGQDAVQTKVSELETRAFLAGVDADIADCEAKVEKGEMSKSDKVVGENDFIVVTIKKADGTPSNPDRNAGPFSTYIPTMREKLVGAAVGAEFAEGEEVVTVAVVYTPVVSPVTEPSAA